MSTKFALLSYSTANLGDSIQSLAVQQFLPTIDLLVDRDSWQTSRADTSGSYKIVLNGWFTHAPENWPPPTFLDSLITSFHLSAERFEPNRSRLPPTEALLRGANLAYLRRHAPIGARDRQTEALLRYHGIDSWFSGCLTLTFGGCEDHQRGDYICAVDIDDATAQLIAARTRYRVLRLTHRDTSGGEYWTRAATAHSLLSLYAHARYVLTTRLHCAIPCLALKTPVFLIIAAPDRYRFTGLQSLVRHAAIEQFSFETVKFDWSDPEPNSDAYLVLRGQLSAQLRQFTGAQKRPFQPATLNDLTTGRVAIANNAVKAAIELLRQT